MAAAVAERKCAMIIIQHVSLELEMLLMVEGIANTIHAAAPEPKNEEKWHSSHAARSILHLYRLPHQARWRKRKDVTFQFIWARVRA